MNAVSERLLSLEEVCNTLQLHRDTVTGLFKSGAIPGAFKVGRVWRIAPSDLQRYVNRKRSEAATIALRGRISQAEFEESVKRANWKPLDWNELEAIPLPNGELNEAA